MSRVQGWLSQIFAARHLERPDGRMLFQYRLTQDEYGAAREILRTVSSNDLRDSAYLRDRDVCALFVMYAAEWWKREYAGGAWRWTPIVQSFAGPTGAIPPMDRTHAIIRGISYWRHLPGSEGKKYFGVLVAHGGLPMRLISQGAGKVNAVLSSALRLAVRYRWDESSVQAAIAERADELSHHLRHEEIYLLMARMVSTVLELKREFALTGIANPVTLLDERDPSWRDRFPLAVDDAAAQQLLVGLVQEASQQAAATGTGEFRAERLLRDNGAGIFELSSLVRHPATVECDVLASVFSLNADDVPRYFTIDVCVGDRQPLCSGRQILGADSASANLSGRHPHWRGSAACQEHLLGLRGPDGDLVEGLVPIPGGLAISPDEPWVFVRQDEQLVLASAGSARVPQDQAVVVCPRGSKIDLGEGGGVIQPLGRCSLNEIHLDVFSIAGDVRIVNASLSYRVRTSQSTVGPAQYVWEGRRLPYQALPWPIYLGPPKLYRHSADGERSRVNLAQLQWYVGGQSEQRIEDASHARGPLDVWLLEDGERQIRFRFVVLDPTARITFASGATENEGAVTFIGWRNAEAAVRDARCEFTTLRGADSIRVDMIVKGSPPQSATLLIKWPGSSREVRIPLPFPATGGRFFDAAGEPLLRDAKLSLRNIVGARLRVFDHNPQAPKKYTVRLTLDAPNASGKVSQLESEHDVHLQRDGTGELRLIDLQTAIQRLMSFSDELDASVCAILYAGAMPLSRMHVTRYDATLVKDVATWRLTETDLAHLNADVLKQVHLCAHPITLARGESIDLAQSESQGVPTGLWSVRPLNSEQAPWLLFPSTDSVIQFRPVLWTRPTEVSGETLPTEMACALGRAMKLGDPEERLAQISQAISDMSVDFTHASWGLLERNFAALRHLPLSCLDAWRVIARSPSAAVACVLRMGCSEAELAHLVNRLRDELGLVWELASMNMWSEASKRMRPYYAQLLGEDLCAQVFPSFLKSRIALLAIELPALALPIQLTLLDAGVEPTPELIEAMRRTSSSSGRLADELWRGSDSLAQRLLFRTHSAEANWPNRGLAQDALSAFEDAMPPESVQKIRNHAKDLLWLPAGRPDHKSDVANVPVICALWSVAAAPLEWWQRNDKSLALRQIRAFDPLWFEAAYKQAVLICMAIGIQPSLNADQRLRGGQFEPSAKLLVVKAKSATTST